MLRRIPAAVFATENTRIYPIKRRRWKQKMGIQVISIHQSASKNLKMLPSTLRN